ncbi:Uncharacterised protein [Xylophilus ampelinus]|uniref:Uncharacterized protein n=1 Tax=Variovorax paradoxus TaxID=34073 RepID=A0A2W5SFA4_VARPD|nr:MAG: hypothetical protein DI563_00810 [Variovorax paradoxus]VTY30179.1 Uncharacterised protein [Xylophilus ampelinus]
MRLPDVPVVGGMKLDFSAAFVHQKSTTELVLVADTAAEDEALLIRKMNGVARALDVSRSRRSLTLVLAGPRPKPATLESLGRVCRVLPLGNVTGADAEVVVSNWLAVLFPLSLPQAEGSATNPLTRIGTLAMNLDEPLRRLVDVAAQGESAVQHGLHQLIDDASSAPEEQDL